MLRLPQEMQTLLKKLKCVFLTIGLVSLLSGCSQLSLPNRSQGALQVTSGEQQTLSLYLDDNHVGETPFFDEHIKTGEYLLKLQSTSSNAVLWQTKVKISKRTLTVVNYDSATNPEESSSEILYLDPLADKKATKLSISTLPDHVVVKIDGQVQGFSPITFDDLTPGDHEILLDAPGYLTKTINAKLTQGHHLIIQTELGRNTSLRVEESFAAPESSQSGTPQTATDSAQLTNTPSPSPSANARFGTTKSNVSLGYESATEINRQAVEILTATVGINWLRVRDTPNGLADNEVARVLVGDFYPYVEDSDNKEWRKIEYAPDKTGWVSSTYAKVVQPE